MTDYECGKCEGLGEICVDKEYVDICVECGGGGWTNSPVEKEDD